MTIIERAEAAIRRGEWQRSRGLPRHYPKQILNELVAELKAARAENERLKSEA